MTHGHSWYWWRSQKPCSVRAENCRRSSRQIDLLSNCGEYGSGNLFYFHKGTTRKLQEGQLDGKSNAIRCPSSTIDQLTLFLGKGVMTCNVSVKRSEGICVRAWRCSGLRYVGILSYPGTVSFSPILHWLYHTACLESIKPPGMGEKAHLFQT